MATLDTVTGLKAKVYTVTPPASYATGGFAVTCDSDYSWIQAVDRPVIVTRGSLPACDFEVDLNVTAAGAESMGNIVIKIVTKTYDKATISTVTGLPGGTATQAAKFAAATVTNSGHTHTMDHNHPSTTSGVATNTGAAVVAGAGNMTTHTHAVDVANFTGNTSSTTHTHERSFEYEHDHSFTETTTDATAAELTAATDISDASLKVTVYGFGKQ